MIFDKFSNAIKIIKINVKYLIIFIYCPLPKSKLDIIMKHYNMFSTHTLTSIQGYNYYIILIFFLYIIFTKSQLQ